MSAPLNRFKAMPSAAEFYAHYWNKRPFVVPGAIAQEEMAALISADELAGLAMEETPRSRLLKTAGEPQNWTCDYGPFDEGDFDAAGDAQWSLLVQNVEQFHPDTAELLRHFDFAPRWLLDDIMVGFSAPGGTVGPHFDTYHVFLVQGQGKRRWKISRTEIHDTDYFDGMDFKVLKNSFDGDEIEVSCGDVLYVPPKFGHEGTTIENAMTFSVGLLGPKTSELFTGYGQYLAEFEDLDQRYVGNGLNVDSAGFTISHNSVGDLQNSLAGQLNAKAFDQWLVEFFTQSSHEDFGIYTEREDELSRDGFAQKLKQGASLIKPRYVKFALTRAPSGEVYLGFDSHSFALDADILPLLEALMHEDAVSVMSHPEMLERRATLELMHELHTHEALEFTD